MTHNDIIVDTDSHFIINPTSRAITQRGNEKIALMQFDHNSERFSFSIPRYVDGHDMSACGRVEVHYINTNTKTKEQIKDKYTVADLGIDPENENQVKFSWLIAQSATKYAGTLAFSIRFLCFDNDTVVYAWNTDRFENILIGDSCDCNGELPDHYDDNYESWKKEIESLLFAHTNNEDEEAAHIHFSRIAAVEVLHLALNLINSSNPNEIAQGSFGVGAGIKILRGQSLGVGLSNTLGGYRNVVVGNGLNDFNESCRAIFGRFNAKNGQAVLIVGWGNNDTDRKNVFTVDKNGNGRFTGKVYAEGQRLLRADELTTIEEKFDNQIADLYAITSMIDSGVGALIERVTTLETQLAEVIEFNDVQQSIIASMQETIAALETKVAELTNA